MVMAKEAPDRMLRVRCLQPALECLQNDVFSEVSSKALIHTEVHTPYFTELKMNMKSGDMASNFLRLLQPYIVFVWV